MASKTSKKNKVNTEEKKFNIPLTEDELKIIVALRVSGDNPKYLVESIYENYEGDDSSPQCAFLEMLYHGKSVEEALGELDKIVSKYKETVMDVKDAIQQCLV